MHPARIALKAKCDIFHLLDSLVGLLAVGQIHPLVFHGRGVSPIIFAPHDLIPKIPAGCESFGPVTTAGPETTRRTPGRV
jgi:hypothetical protein